MCEEIYFERKGLVVITVAINLLVVNITRQHLQLINKY